MRCNAVRKEAPSEAHADALVQPGQRLSVDHLMPCNPSLVEGMGMAWLSDTRRPDQEGERQGVHGRDGAGAARAWPSGAV